MAFETDRTTWTRGQAEAATIDVGLRTYMLRVYNYMASGLALTGLVAWFVANTPAVTQLFFQVGARGQIGMTGLGWLAVLSPIILVFAINYGMSRMQGSTVQALFWAYAALMGISLASILLAYTGASVARTFFATSAGFAGLSLYGYTTKRDLSAFGRFLMVGLIGLIVASLISMFIPSPGFTFALSVIGVLLFAGLTAYDTQKIKEMYYAGDDGETITKKAMLGALTLYLDFINLFMFLIRFMGDRRN